MNSIHDWKVVGSNLISIQVWVCVQTMPGSISVPNLGSMGKEKKEKYSKMGQTTQHWKKLQHTKYLLYKFIFSDIIVEGADSSGDYVIFWSNDNFLLFDISALLNQSSDEDIFNFK